MSIIKTEIKATVFLELTEGEAGALSQICSYDAKIFIEWFERNCGKHYIAPYKNHIESLFQKAKAVEYEVNNIQKIRSEIKVRNV